MLLSALALSAAFHAAAPARCDASGADRTPTAARADRHPITAPRGASPRALSVPDSALAALYETGIGFDRFLAEARARRALWTRNAADAQVPADVLAVATALPGRWRLLAVTVDGCSDSVNTIPYLARLAELVPQLELRIISPRAGREVMAARRTPDGRAATPTVVILDEAGREAGCWIERPAALQRLAIEAKAGGGTTGFAATKQGWYDADAGASTVREVVALLTAAAGGARGCDGGSPSEGQ